MSHLEKRKDKYLAVLTIPHDLRHHFNKIRHVKSTGTGDKQKAQVVAYRLVSEWKQEFAELRGEPTSTKITPLDEALSIRRQIEEAGQEGDESNLSEQDHLRMVIKDLIDQRVASGDYRAASAIQNIALMNQEPIAPHLKDWGKQLHLKPKTEDQMRRDAELFAEFFPTISDITPSSVHEWARHLVDYGGRNSEGLGSSSIERIFGAARSVWQYLQGVGKAPRDKEPLKTPDFIKRLKRSQGRNSWVPFMPEELVSVLEAAKKRGDESLVNLIQLSMYTGARINELCNLKCSECTSETLRISDSKTKAGIREVPVHSAIKPLVGRLIESSQDGYLLSGLSRNKYGLADALGKRCNRLIRRMGFPPLKVQHSIRGTVSTMLENAGVTENLAADIVGHDKPRLTYGLYSDGHSLERKRVAVELLEYPLSSRRGTA